LRACRRRWLSGIIAFFADDRVYAQKVGVMYRPSRVVSFFFALILSFTFAQVAVGQTSGKNHRQAEGFDPVEFIKRFKMGMSYTEVQAALPKNAEQDILSYIVTEDLFLLTVDLPTGGNWSASFRFDTLDTPMRKPERLVELSCSATISSRSATFESILRRVTDAFGEPVKVEHAEGNIHQAGWRVTGGSILTLEYSFVPTALVGSDVNVDFIVRKNTRRDASSPRAVA
jgi:hypothetical protein